MTKYFIRSTMFLILFLPQPTHSVLCATNVASCPGSEDEITERRRTYNCTSGFLYTCLPDADYDYHERCSPAFYILNGTGGCPFIVKCHDRLGFIYGNTVSFKPCPKNKTGCPPVYHSSYKIQDLYKYPACFYKDGDIPTNSVYRQQGQRSKRERRKMVSHILKDPSMLNHREDNFVEDSSYGDRFSRTGKRFLFKKTEDPTPRSESYPHYKGVWHRKRC